MSSNTHLIAAVSGAPASGWGRPRLEVGDVTQALPPDPMAYDVTLTKSLHCLGLIFLCKMKGSLKIPSGSCLPIMQLAG